MAQSNPTAGQTDYYHNEVYTRSHHDKQYTENHHKGNSYTGNHGKIETVNYGIQSYGDDTNNKFYQQPGQFNYGVKPIGHHREAPHSHKTPHSRKTHSSSSGTKSIFRRKKRYTASDSSDNDSD